MTKRDAPIGAIPCPAGSYPRRGGNFVRPLVDGVPAFRRIGEAVDAARRSIWLTVTFYADDFRFPDGRGDLFEALDRAAARGVDVRVLFWRPNSESSGYGSTFPGSAADRELLGRRGARVAIRWDRSPAAYCQHQKAWIIDAGEPGEVAFVGGINLTAANLGVPGHPACAPEPQRHDLYVELAGPSATDVHHNFVQRWNEASESGSEDGRWGQGAASALPFPTRTSAPRGGSIAQVQRMVPPGRYRDGTPTPGAARFDIGQGEHSILEQYELAIAAARRTIYIENQALPVPRVAECLEQALSRGVEVVYLAPSEPEDHVRAARRSPERRPFFERIEALGKHPGFTLVGLTGPSAGSGRRSVYVHAKIMLVDDAWATIGSCNLHLNSLSGHTEMNVAIWDPEVVRALRCELFTEHLDDDVAGLDDRAALMRFREVAASNRGCAERREHAGWRGLAFSLDPATYGF